ncbi:MAG: hypothetical protein ABR914_09880 [Dehalococcoidales bacterium]|jgi:hypothetical protein
MAKNLYENNVKELIKSIEECLQNKEKISCLILLYSTIDILVWLSRDPHDADATKDDFVSWIDEFLLPGSGLNCSADDLYAGRSALVHSYAQSWGVNQNFKGEIGKIHYVWGKVSKETVKHDNGNRLQQAAIDLPVEKLLTALQNAVQRFNNSLIDNRTLFELVDERSQKYFI